MAAPYIPTAPYMIPKAVQRMSGRPGLPSIPALRKQGPLVRRQPGKHVWTLRRAGWRLDRSGSRLQFVGRAHLHVVWSCCPVTSRSVSRCHATCHGMESPRELAMAGVYSQRTSTCPGAGRGGRLPSTPRYSCRPGRPWNRTGSSAEVEMPRICCGMPPWTQATRSFLESKGPIPIEAADGVLLQQQAPSWTTASPSSLRWSSLPQLITINQCK
jgi:hypothetical protein